VTGHHERLRLCGVDICLGDRGQFARADPLRGCQPPPDPLSILTIASLGDIGYNVNRAQAGAYALPGHLTSDLSGGTATGSSETSATTAGQVQSDVAFVDEDELYVQLWFGRRR